MMGPAMKIRLAGRMERLGTESAFEVLARARALEAEGRTIIHLEIGEPDFDTPEHIRDAAKAALDAGHTHYVPAPGIMPLRRRSRASSSGPDGCALTRRG
jgi:aspartate aminotransferase